MEAKGRKKIVENRPKKTQEHKGQRPSEIRQNAKGEKNCEKACPNERGRFQGEKNLFQP
ncbi:MAG TPA: hypothetical protein VJH23_00195 [archaeon]|nr:hypothetical protein [archaeon]